MAGRRVRLVRIGVLTLVLLPLGACSVDELFSSGDDAPRGQDEPGPQEGPRLSFNVQPKPSAVGLPIAPPVEVTARDAEGNPATGFTGTVQLTLDAETGTLIGATARRAERGVVAFPGVIVIAPARTYRLRATADGSADAVSEEFVVFSAPGPVVAVVEGDGQTDTVAATLPTPCVILVADGEGTPLAGIEVAWSVTEGKVLRAEKRSGANGEARATHRLGPTAGEQPITASVPDALGSPVACVATATPGTAVDLLFTQEPSDAEPGAAISPPVVVAVLDQFDNRVVGFGDSVSLSIDEGTGFPFATLSGTLTRSAESGAATFDDLRIDDRGFNYRLRATVGGLTVRSGRFDIW